MKALSLLACLAFATTASAQFSVSGGGAAIPDNGGVWDPNNVDHTFGTFGSATVNVPDPVVCIDSVTIDGLNHTWTGDLLVVLRDPTGVGHIVSLRPELAPGATCCGCSGDFDATSHTFVEPGSAGSAGPLHSLGCPAVIPGGTYDQNLDSGAGVSWPAGDENTFSTNLIDITGPAGDWTLEIHDFAAADTGSWTGWTLVGNNCVAPPEPPCPVGLTMVDTIGGAFVDISGTGTPLSLSDDGEVGITTTVGNALLAAGSVGVGANGGVRFDGTSLSLAFTNAAIPSGGAFGGEQCLLPFWDDFDIDSGNDGEIYWQEIGGVLYIQWQTAAFFPGGGDTATLQVQVPSTGPAFAQFLYQDIMQARPDGGGSATIGYQAGGIGTDAQWSFNTPGSVMDGTVLSLITVPGLGTSYCGPANANSTGMPATIRACGSDVTVNNDVKVTAEGLPPGEFGYFLVGRTQGFFMPMGSSGNICLMGDIGRYNSVDSIIAGPSGSVTIDLTDLPTNNPGSQMTIPGDTLSFQCWYRDGGTNNFTDGVAILFL